MICKELSIGAIRSKKCVVATPQDDNFCHNFELQNAWRNVRRRCQELWQVVEDRRLEIRLVGQERCVPSVAPAGSRHPLCLQDQCETVREM